MQLHLLEARRVSSALDKLAHMETLVINRPLLYGASSRKVKTADTVDVEGGNIHMNECLNIIYCYKAEN